MAALALAWPGAVAIGLSLGLLGSGGSILTVPVLIYLLGQPERLAIAGSLAIVGTIATFSTLPYVRAGLVNWRAAALFGLPGMAGTYVGAWLSLFVSGAFQLSLFALVMLTASILMLKPIPLRPHGAPRALWKVTLDGLAVGVLTGLVGVGGGFLIVPALVLLGGLPMRQAVGTSLVIIALKSFSGFYKYFDILRDEGISLDLEVLVLVSALGVLGSFGGNLISKKVSQPLLKKIFGWFLIVMAIAIGAQSAPKLF